MMFYYKTKDGNTGMVRDVDTLPSDIRKLIVRRYNGSVFALPYVDELVLDCNRDNIHRMLFKCDRLYIYKPYVNWFHINNVWVNYDVETSSTFNTLVRLKLECVRNTNCMLKDTLCNNIIPELDFSNLKSKMGPYHTILSPMFYNTQLTSIPKMVNPPAIPYMTIFDGALIPESKLKAADVLVTISKKGEVS